MAACEKSPSAEYSKSSLYTNFIDIYRYWRKLLLGWHLKNNYITWKIMGLYTDPERQLTVWKSLKRELNISKFILAPSNSLETRSNISFPSLFLSGFLLDKDWAQPQKLQNTGFIDSICLGTQIPQNYIRKTKVIGRSNWKNGWKRIKKKRANTVVQVIQQAIWERFTFILRRPK